MSFLNEKAKGFYVNPETEENASVMEQELVVLEPPTAVSKQRTYGFQFPEIVSSILKRLFLLTRNVPKLVSRVAWPLLA